MKHIMVDLETLGLTPSSVFLSCGLVSFDPTLGEVDEEKAACLYPSIKEQVELGRTQDKETISWWERQTPEARAETFVDVSKQTTLPEFHFRFRSWLNDNSTAFKSRYIWSNGAGFDIVILEDLFRAMQMGVPWVFWNIRDTRTAWDMANVTYKKGKNLISHSAKHDAIEQAQRVCKAYEVLGLQKESR